MGQSASTHLQPDYAKQQSEIPAKGHWVSDFKTGYRWATDPIKSGPEVVKKPLGNTVPQFEDNTNLKMIFSLPGYPGEVWGPYHKQFTSSMFGGKVFTPPESIDGIDILCRCRDIKSYIRDEEGGRMLNGIASVGFGKNVPMCWDDTETLWNQTGGMYYYVMTRHPDFYAYEDSNKGMYGVIENIVENPIKGTAPLALGSYYASQTDKKKTGAAKRKRRRNKTVKRTRKAKRTTVLSNNTYTE